MFLDVTKKRNPELLDAAQALHRSGKILPDTFVLDLDVIIENAMLLKKSADEAGIDLFYMAKQIGRNPLVARHIVEAGIKKAVVVDFKEARLFIEHGLAIGHAGHLVQIPVNFLDEILHARPDYITVYSIEALSNLEHACNEKGISQNVLIKIQEKDDEAYAGQHGGFSLSEIPHLAGIKFNSVKLSGLTTFPCFLPDGKGDFYCTNNVETLQKAKAIFRENGVELAQLNLPSATCCKTTPLIKALGGTQGEPGHALTGTTPLHAVIDMPERPAIVYVSEISHHLEGNSFFYGGGYYRRGHFNKALIGDGNNIVETIVKQFPAENIDYYLEAEGRHPIGATVLGAFRAQIFTSRSDVAVVSGIQSGRPRLEGIFDSAGNRAREL